MGWQLFLLPIILVLCCPPPLDLEPRERERRVGGKNRMRGRLQQKPGCYFQTSCICVWMHVCVVIKRPVIERTCCNARFSRMVPWCWPAGRSRVKAVGMGLLNTDSAVSLCCVKRSVSRAAFPEATSLKTTGHRAALEEF